MLTQKNIYKQTMINIGWQTFSKMEESSQITFTDMLHSPSFSVSDKSVPLIPISTGNVLSAQRAVQLNGALQYHWCPSAKTDIEGSLTSSIKYNNRVSITALRTVRDSFPSYGSPSR